VHRARGVRTQLSCPGTRRRPLHRQVGCAAADPHGRLGPTAMSLDSASESSAIMSPSSFSFFPPPPLAPLARGDSTMLPTHGETRAKSHMAHFTTDLSEVRSPIVPWPCIRAWATTATCSRARPRSRRRTPASSTVHARGRAAFPRTRPAQLCKVRACSWPGPPRNRPLT